MDERNSGTHSHTQYQTMKCFVIIIAYYFLQVQQITSFHFSCAVRKLLHTNTIRFYVRTKCRIVLRFIFDLL